MRDREYTGLWLACVGADVLLRAERSPVVVWRLKEDRYVLRSLYKGAEGLEQGAQPVASAGCLSPRDRKLREKLFAAAALQKRSECGNVTEAKGER